MLIYSPRRDCFRDVRVKADYGLVYRAKNNPKNTTITVSVPKRRRNIFKEALIHERAHHVEFRCEAHKEMRATFLQVQGSSINAPSRPEKDSAFLRSSDWAAIPSEQNIETTIVVVLGKRPVSTLAPITEEGTRIISAWARKESLTCPSGNWVCTTVEHQKICGKIL